MAPVRSPAAVIVAASIVALAAGPLFAGEITHFMCAAKHHDCARVPTLTQCCCGHPGDVSSPPATGTDRVIAATAGLNDPGAVAVVGESTATRGLPRAADTSPPLNHSPNLPVLFSDLRL